MVKIDIKITEEQRRLYASLSKEFGGFQFSPEQIEKVRETSRVLGAMGGSITDIPGLPVEARCVRDGHKVVRITGNMYQCRICAREFTHVGQMDTGELWREFWRRVNAKRKRFGVARLFSDLLREIERLQGWG